MLYTVAHVLLHVLLRVLLRILLQSLMYSTIQILHIVCHHVCNTKYDTHLTPALQIINECLDGLIAKCRALVEREDADFNEEFLSEDDPSILHFLLASGGLLSPHAAPLLHHRQRT